MTTLEPGVTGAKRISWLEDNPRAVFEQVMRENRDNKTATEAAMYARFLELIQDDVEAYLPGLAQYFWTHAIGSWTGTTSRKPRAKHGAAVHRTKEKMKAKLVERIILLDIRLPGGKLLRDATFGDCRRSGGWLIELGKQGKANERVTRKLTEEQIAAVWKRFATS